ncbi:MAG: PHB depolymerase family esterase [Myxococcota bacterium]|nr:PHB depolymerase family esterase [Myxococcota bacterium]
MLFALLLACSKPASKTIDTTDEQVASQPSLTPPENGVNTFAYDGLERQFRVHIPNNLPADAPLVIVMHGFTSSAQIIEAYSRMNAVADEHGFVVAYPQGTKDASGNTFFNVGYEFHESNGVDDIGFLHALIEYLQQSLSLSSRNVFSTGMSNGGDMSYMLAFQSDVVRAIAPVAGCMMKHIYDTCTPTKPVPVLEIHGTRDSITLVDGDIENQEGWGSYMPLEDTIQFWVNHNQLELSDVVDIADTNTGDGSTVIHHRYYSQTGHTEVWLYEVVGGGHDWPGAFGNQDIDASSLAWQFFSRYLE